MDKQTFGEDERTQGQLREQPVEPSIKVHVVLREEDLVEAYALLLPVRWWRLAAVIIVFVAAAAALLNFTLVGFYVLSACCLPLGWWIHRLYNVMRARRVFRQWEKELSPITWSFDADGASYSTAEAEGRQKWSQFSRVYEIPRQFVLYWKHGSGGSPLPKRGFADADAIEEFREFCRRYGLGPQPPPWWWS